MEDQLRDLNARIDRLAERNAAILKWEVYDRIAQAANNESWRSITEQKMLEVLWSHKMGYLPILFTVEAVRRWEETGTPEVPALLLYPADVIDSFRRDLSKYKGQPELEKLVDLAWQTVDPVDREIMLISWAKRSQPRDKGRVYCVPSVIKAKELIRQDHSLEGHRERVEELISYEADARGCRLFDTYDPSLLPALGARRG